MAEGRAASRILYRKADPSAGPKPAQSAQRLPSDLLAGHRRHENGQEHRAAGIGAPANRQAEGGVLRPISAVWLL